MLQTADIDNVPFDDVSIPYMSLSLGSVILLARQSEIVSIGSIQDIDLEKPSERSIGWIHFDNHNIPVYCLTDKFEIDHFISNDKTIYVVLKNDDTYISLMCAEATSFKHQVVKLHPLPDCMQAAPCPIKSLCLYKDVNNNSDVNFVISANSLASYI